MAKKNLKLGLGESLPKGDATISPNVTPKDLGIDENTEMDIDDSDGVKDYTPQKLNKDVVKEKKKHLNKKKKGMMGMGEYHGEMGEYRGGKKSMGCGCGCGGKQGGCKDKYGDGKGRGIGSALGQNMPLVLGVGVIGLALGMMLSK